ncbi:hypothetical protein, partial [Salmonella sp. s55044]|uniref:hypothetical protein n=1 Tax=Salmonella sp. s55044 TaxID=3159677 RepID=UPI00397F1B8F
DYEKLGDLFSPEECCYVVMDIKWKNDIGAEKAKLVFIAWVPDTAVVKKRMLYASTQQDLIKKLDGIQVKVQANDSSDVTFDALKAAALKTMSAT